MSRPDANMAYRNLVPCTLYSGNYHYGVAGLANSIYRSGFRGTMCIGYVPPLPPWARGAQQDGDDTILRVSPDFVLRFIPWRSVRNLSMEKARFLLHILDDVAPETAEGVLFFDADITVHCSWGFFEGWLAEGIALCVDGCYPVVAARHPWRGDWLRLIEQAGYTKARDLEYYVNSGFVGIPRAERQTVLCWSALIDTFLQSEGKVADSVKFASRENAFVGDQDMLNAALMATTAPLSLIGPEGMDFQAAGYTMSHAVEGVKPWRKNFVIEAATGNPPSRADKCFWRYIDGPIRPFGSRHIAAQRLMIKLASLVGRFYRRS